MVLWVGWMYVVRPQGTRETDLLHPVNLVDRVHAICLTGGSAFGLATADGVMNYLEEKKIGLNTGFGIVPIVPAAGLFDLSLGDSSVRPDAKMGFDAVSRASKHKVQEGNVGAGCGASVGKLSGFDSSNEKRTRNSFSDSTEWLGHWSDCSSERGRRSTRSAYE